MYLRVKININNLYCFIQNSQCVVVKNIMTTSTVWCIVLPCAKGPTVLPTNTFADHYKM